MKKIILTWWDDLKSFNWKMFLALCLLSLVPAIYQTVVTGLITTQTSPGNLDIVGQMEWFDLINETLCAFLIIPMYSILSKAKKTESFNKIVFKLGVIIFVLYLLFSLGTFFYGINLISYMNPNEIDINAAYGYLSLETIAFMIGIIFSYVSVVFVVVNKEKIMYVFLSSKIILSLISDFFLIPSIGIYGIAISNIISNVVMGLIGVISLLHMGYLKVCKYNKEDVSYLKDWSRIGLFSGGQQFLDNIIYALMIVRMVNAVGESGNYWVANNFIWGWLLIPIMCLSEIIRKDAGEKGYKIKQSAYYIITIITILMWFILIPTYQWFFTSVEKLSNPSVIFDIVVMNLGFYVAYALSQIPDAIFVGTGKTKFNAINSLICNIGYYGLWFVLYITNIVVMDINMIIVMFGIGNIVHWIVSIIEEKVFLKNN